MRRSARLLLLPALLAGPLMAAPKPLKDQPLRWTPTSKISELGIGSINLMPFEGKTFEVLPFVDNRPNPALVGENREKEEKGEVLTVETRDKVADFVTEQTRTFFKDLGLPVAAGPAKVQVGGEILSFLVTESSMYKAEIRLKVQVKSAGKTVWAGMAIGSAKRFGRSYKMDNYLEALCDGFLDAWAGLAKSPEFMKALAEGK